MVQVPNHIFVRSRWVTSNKGDHNNPDLRARLVACELNKGGERVDSFFAITPPLEAKRILFSQLAQELERKGRKLRINFIARQQIGYNNQRNKKTTQHVFAQKVVMHNQVCVANLID